MADFTFDTSGHVLSGFCAAGDPDTLYAYKWPDLDAFTQGYVEALFASVEDRNEDGEPQLQTAPQPGPPPYEAWLVVVGFSDLAPETLAAILKDCAAFQAERPGLSDTTTNGAMLWEARQVGRWSAFPPLTPHLGDDGKVYLRERA